MKTTKLILLFSLAIPLAIAENEAPSNPSPPADQPGLQKHEPGKARKDGPKKRFLERLSPEIRQRFLAARTKALEDPALKALKDQAEKSNKEFFEALRKKMQEIDPGLDEIIRDKRKLDGPREGRHWKKGGGKPGAQAGRGLANLDEGERQRLMAAREVAKADPSVQAAEAKLKEASSPEDRRAAYQEFSKAMNETILKADPSMKAILDKIPARPMSKDGEPGKKPEA